MSFHHAIGVETSFKNSTIEHIKNNDQDNSSTKPINGYDIKTWPNKPASFLAKLARVVTATQLASLLSYLRLLIQASYDAESYVPKLLVAAQGVEFFTSITDLTVSLTGQVLCSKQARPKRRILGDNVPGVDVIITTCKEDLETVMDTVRAAVTLDWPANKLRVLVSDDGPDSYLKVALEELKQRYPNLHYYTRPKIPGKHHGFKAGNMNQAIRHLAGDEFEGAPNKWIAILDADMIPDQDWLRALMPHVMVEADVGMITIPQDFYNIPINDPLHENLTLQHEAEQSLRDRMGAAWCPGSGFMFDRAAWDKVGGFSETSMCDDVLFGWTLNGKGYKTAAIKERLQSGMQPSTFADHIKQRRRWTIGGMRNARELGYGFHPKLLGDSSFWQKLAAFNQLPKPFINTIGKLIFWMLIFFCILSGNPVVSTSDAQLEKILASYAVFVVSTRISEYMLASSGFGIQNIRRRQIVGTWQNVHLAKACVQELIPSWLGGSSLGFLVTGQKNAADIPLEERDITQRPRMVERIRRLHKIESVLNHLYFFVAVVSALAAQSILLYLKYGLSKALMHALIITIFFPGMRIENVMHFLSPVWYIMFPPVEKPREAYLTEDHDTGFRRPLVWERGSKFTRGMYVWEAWTLMATAWAVVAWWFVARRLPQSRRHDD